MIWNSQTNTGIYTDNQGCIGTAYEFLNAYPDATIEDHINEAGMLQHYIIYNGEIVAKEII